MNSHKYHRLKDCMNQIIEEYYAYTKCCHYSKISKKQEFPIFMRKERKIYHVMNTPENHLKVQEKDSGFKKKNQKAN